MRTLHESEESKQKLQILDCEDKVEWDVYFKYFNFKVYFVNWGWN